jgi:peptide/nickel transport system substrate-binding protein
MAWTQEPDSLRPKFAQQGVLTGTPEFMFNSALTLYDNHGTLRPMMAERLPAQENGDWVVNADGTMVTIYRVRQNVRWHDGVPLTARDFAFAYRVYVDPGMPVIRDIERKMAQVEARDDHTLVIAWSELYPLANALGFSALPPLPRHLLEEKYRTAPANEFVSGDEWSTSYVGSGPYRLERWDRGASLTARAYPEWFLGPPRIQTVEVRFIGDPNTVLGHLLAGEVDFASTPVVRFDIPSAKDLWAGRSDGYMRSWETRMRWMEFQYREVPNWQRAVTDPRVRQALIHAIDRPAIAEVMTGGLGRAGEAWVLPGDPMFAEIDRAITKYPYDPQRAAVLLGEAGWRIRAGSLLTDAEGKTLDVEMNGGSTGPQIASIIADNWKATGVNSSVATVPPALSRDPVFRATFPASHIGEVPITPFTVRFVQAQIADPPRTIGWNAGGFSDPEVERLNDLVLTTLDAGVRRTTFVALNKRLSDLAAYAPLYHPVELFVARSRVKGPVGEYAGQQSITWNIFEWEVTD